MAKRNVMNKPIGKLGNRVYYYINGVYTSRAYVIPNQPASNPQRTWWREMRTAVRQWQMLSSGEKEALNRRAKPFRYSGFNLYVSEYLKP